MAGGGEEGRCNRDDIVTRTCRHFPTRRREVAVLVQASERFGELCDEPTVAEMAPASVDQAPLHLRAERRIEWLSYVRDALAAPEAELQSFNVLPIERPARGEL